MLAEEEERTRFQFFMLLRIRPFLTKSIGSVRMSTFAELEVLVAAQGNVVRSLKDKKMDITSALEELKVLKGKLGKLTVKPVAVADDKTKKPTKFTLKTPKVSHFAPLDSKTDCTV